MPDEPLLLAAGALLSTDLGVAVPAWLQCELGLPGHQILRLLAVFRSARLVYARRPRDLRSLRCVVAPGREVRAGVAQPLAGIVGMRRSWFVLFDVACAPP